MSSKRHVYKTGAAGCGGKAASVNAKNSGQPIPCPFCDRIFKQDGRLKEHLKNKHPDEDRDNVAGSSSSSPDEPITQQQQQQLQQQQSTYPAKTPKTLLHEWCQKNKRPSPKFMHVENEGGFICRVILPDSKKSELDVILWCRDPTPNSQEAHHRAAVMALHHVMGDRRIDRILPEDYRQQWHQLDARAAEREAKLKLKAEKPKRPANRARELQSVFMSEGNRRLIEELLTDRNTSSSEARSSTNHDEMSAVLLEMGFKHSHVQAALEQARDVPSALDWLMLNVQEAELPAKFAPQASKSSVRVVQRGVEYGDDPAHELTEFGYEFEDCKTAFREAGSLDSALARLFFGSIQHKHHPSSSFTSGDAATMREEEQIVLGSIYPAAVVSEGLMMFDFDVEFASTKLSMEVRLPGDSSYPFELPVIAFRGKNLKPGYLRSVTQNVAKRGLELLGMPMMYELVCYAAELCNSPVEEAAAASSSMPNETKSGVLLDAPEATKRSFKTRKPIDLRSLTAESLSLKQQWENLQNSSQYADTFSGRKKLPAFKKRSEILAGIKNSRVTIICGETGCGKSTQVPQYVLEDCIKACEGAACNIICTQPRRIAALGLAARVAKERNEPVGRMVGYSVRLDNCSSKQTKLLYCTTGILLRRMISDPELDGVTHIFIDEVHERSLENDLLLLLLRNHLQSNTGKSLLRVILMSATADANTFTRYFQQGSPSLLHIPGFTFPVREHYLEDVLELTGYKISRNSRFALKKKPSEKAESLDTSWETRACDDWESDSTPGAYSETTRRSLAMVDESIINYELIETLLYNIFSLERNNPAALRPQASAHEIEKAGSILVFLPGMMEIRSLQTRLRNSRALAEFGVESGWVLALHGSLSSDEQRRVFLRPPAGVRKLVLATNVAETSITIDDILYVIDTGRHKEMSYDPEKGLASLTETWISKASSKQRAGRAGRVQPGCCLRLYSRKKLQELDDHQLPEVQRVPLEGLCLKVKTLLGWKLEAALAQMPTPAEPQAVASAVESLKSIGALGIDESLTPLGRHLSQMPVDARIGKMLVFACMLRCLDPVLTIAAAMSGRPVFLSPQDNREEARLAKLKLSGGSKSDHLALVAAYNGWVAAKQSGWNGERDYCASNFLSREALLGIEASREDYTGVLRELGFVSADESLETNSSSGRVIKAVVCAGFYPNVARVRHPEKTYVQTEGGTVPKLAAAHEIHYFTKFDGRVFLHPASVNFSVGHFESCWLVMSDKVKTSKVYVRECSMVSAYSLLIFGGSISVQHEKQMIVVDGWLEFEAPARIAVLIKELRKEVDSLLLEKIENPGLNLSCKPVVSALLKLLQTDGF